MKFIGRKKELEAVQRALSDNSQANILIYGRRRIGKTWLINEALKDFSGIVIHYQCQQTSYADNISKLSEIISRAFGNIGSFPDIESVLKFLFTRQEKIVLALDEYPFLREEKKGLDGIFQSYIDKYSSSSSLKIIFSGSYVSVMKEMGEYKAPLFGRLKTVINLGPLNYKEACEFISNLESEGKVKALAVFGGSPYCLATIDTKKSIKENIIDNIISLFGSLHSEPELVLNSELSNASTANLLFQLISKGYTKFSQIKKLSGIASVSVLSNGFNSLMEMNLIAKRVPINKPADTKKTFYDIVDPFLAFYYRYIYSNASALNVMSPDNFYKYIETDFETEYIPYIFEKICRDFLILNNDSDKYGINFVKIGKYWYDNPKTKTNVEFDIVTQNKEKEYVVYEVKYTDKPMTSEQVIHLEDAVNKSEINSKSLGFFSKSGYTKEALKKIKDKGYQAYDLGDLFAN